MASAYIGPHRSRGVLWCYRGTLYHVQAAKATPSSGPLPDFISFCLSPQPSARTEAKNANSCTIEFCADGRFTNVTTNSNWDCPIINGVARTPCMPRIKEGFEGS